MKKQKILNLYFIFYFILLSLFTPLTCYLFFRFGDFFKQITSLKLIFTIGFILSSLLLSIYSISLKSSKVFNYFSIVILQSCSLILLTCGISYLFYSFENIFPNFSLFGYITDSVNFLLLSLLSFTIASHFKQAAKDN